MQTNQKIWLKIRFLTYVSALILFTSACTNASDNNSSLPTPNQSKLVDSADEQDVNNSQFTILTSGDILLHERTWTQAKKDGSNTDWDFYPQFAGIADLTESVDLALCHLETPIANKNEDYSGYPIFNSPPEILTTLKKLGFDMCSTASNHSLDKGFSGITRTLTKLDEVGIAHTGMARTIDEAKTPLVLDVKRGNQVYKVGIVSYTYGFNGLVRDNDKPWSANLIDSQSIINEATAARNAGAQLVIAKLHWGNEYTNKANSFQIDLATQLANSGVIDLIDGSHSHSVQPVTKIKNTWVAYSHGNLIAAHREPETIKSEGLIMRWTVSKNSAGILGITKVEQFPILITDKFPVRIVNVSETLAKNDFSLATERRLIQALDRTVKAVNSLGGEIPLGE